MVCDMFVEFDFFSFQHYVNAKTDYWNITCDHERYSPYTGERTVEVKVKEKVAGFIWIAKATARINFNLTGKFKY